jgi:hypothetical protein
MTSRLRKWWQLWLASDVGGEGRHAVIVVCVYVASYAALDWRAGQILTRRELISRVWADVTVEEANLRVHVAALRKAKSLLSTSVINGSAYYRPTDGPGQTARERMFQIPQPTVYRCTSARRSGGWVAW